MAVDAGGGRARDEPRDARAVRLVLPADHAWGRVARTAVAGLALRLGFSYPQIEDLRLAVDEALILLLRPPVASTSPARAGEGRVEVRMEPEDSSLVIDVSTSVGPATDPSDSEALAEARDRFEQLVGPTVDGWAVSEDGRHVHLVKRRGR